MKQVSKKILAIMLVIYIVILVLQIYTSVSDRMLLSYLTSDQAVVGFYYNIPPVLIANISDIEWNKGYSYSGLDLDDYFNDTPGELLNYTASGNLNIGIAINNESIVTFEPVNNQYTGSETVNFTAHDPYGLTADSNAVTLTVVEYTPPPSSTPSPAGGSGMSGRKLDDVCISEWACTDWSKCTTPLGSRDGIQNRSCVDINKCNDNTTMPSPIQTCKLPTPPKLIDTETIEEVFVPVVKEVSHRPVLWIVVILIVVFVVEMFIYLHQHRKKPPRVQYSVNYGT